MLNVARCLASYTTIYRPTPGAYLNPAVIWAPALIYFVASKTQKLPVFFINRQATRHHANAKVYHIYCLLICDFHVIKLIHSSTHNHSKLNLFIHNYIITLPPVLAAWTICQRYVYVLYTHWLQSVMSGFNWKVQNILHGSITMVLYWSTPPSTSRLVCMQHGSQFPAKHDTVELFNYSIRGLYYCNSTLLVNILMSEADAKSY